MNPSGRMISYGTLYAPPRHKGRTITPELQRKLRKYQRRMRHNPTEAEKRFKLILLSFFKIKNPKHIKRIIIQQKQFFTIGADGKEKGYIGDFYIIPHKILFEIDGESHNNPTQKRYDQIRTAALAEQGIKTIRITNKQTIDVNLCKQLIYNAIHNKKAKKKQAVKLTRQQELQLQTEYIAKYGTTRIGC